MPSVDRGSSFSKWPNNRMVAVVKHCWLLVQGIRGWRERWLQTTTGWVLNKILWCSVSCEVIIIALLSCLYLKDQLGLCSINCHIHPMTGNCSASLRVVSAMAGNYIPNTSLLCCDGIKHSSTAQKNRYHKKWDHVKQPEIKLKKLWLFE